MSDASALENAVCYLAGVCDGAVTRDGHGFNGADATFGHSLAACAGHWTGKQEAAARRLVQKYRQQVFDGTGIDVTALAAATPEDVVADLAPSSVSRQILGPGGVIARQLPGYEHRESQLELAELVEDALARREHVVAEAGTGTGKTLAYLIPAIMSGKRTIVATADKALQSQIIGKDAPFLHQVMPREFSAVLMKGRANYLCLHRMDDLQNNLLREEFFTEEEARQSWRELERWAEETDDGDLDGVSFELAPVVRAEVTVTSDECLRDQCRFYQECFVERAKRAAASADVIVTNHALLLRDMAIRGDTDAHAHVLPDAPVCVVDEAHHLEAAAVDALGCELRMTRWYRIVGRLRRLVKGTPAEQFLGTADGLSKLGESLFDSIRLRIPTTAASKTQLLGDEQGLRALASTCRTFRDRLENERPEWLDDEQRVSWGKVGDTIESWARDVLAVATPSDYRVRYATVEVVKGVERVALCAKPIEVADLLNSLLFTRLETGRFSVVNGKMEPVATGYESVVCTSATLADGDGFGHWRGRVGLERARELIVSSPFDYANHALIYLPSDGTAFDPAAGRDYTKSASYMDALCGAIEELIAACPGGIFLLFTTNRVLHACYDRLRSYLPSRLVLKQGTRPRQQLLKEFKDAGNAVLFATKSFWEGVDVPGDALSLVVIDKLPFAPPDDPVWQAKCDAVNRRRGDKWAWFDELAIPEATVALKQGVGRLIRSRTDEGVIALLDGRLVTKRYGERILRALPPAPITQSLDDVREFYA